MKRALTLSCLLLAAPTIGCQFSAKASGEASTGGESKSEAEASMTTEPEKTPPPAPAEPSAIRYEQGKLNYEGTINFEYNKADLQKDDATKKTLSDFKAFLEKYPEVNIEIEGHTDSRASNDYNRKLSDRRAASVKAWLTSNGIAEKRVTSVGKGEDEPQTPEPAECKDQHPKDTTPCEAIWAKNRRVQFKVTEGASTIPKQTEPAPAPAPEPAPEPVAKPAPPAEKKCHWLYGPRGTLIGPNSWAQLAGAVQPCLDWLELSLGVGVGFGKVEGDSAVADADGHYWSFTIPLGARIWPFRVHSPIADLGIGITHYRISADAEDGAGNSFDYKRRTTPWIAHLGVGYGWRPNGPEPGFRLAIVIGALFHLNKLKGSSVSTDPGFPAAGATELQQSLDDDTDDLKKLEPYLSLSAGWMFE